MKANRNPNIKYMNRYVQVPCGFCKTPIYRSKFTIKNGVLPFCSEDCKIFHSDPKQALLMNHANDNNFYYLVGLISTDGYVKYPGCGTKQNNHACVIKLCTADASILKKIQTIFGGIIKEENHGNTTSWYISNKEFIRYLINVVKLTNNKTYNIDVTNWFNSLLPGQKNAFMRGVIDGDGGIYIKQTNTFRCHVSICSASLPFINMLHSYIGGRISIRKRETTQHLPIKATCDLYYLMIDGRNVLNLEDVYNITPADLVLTRKYIVFGLIKQYFINA